MFLRFPEGFRAQGILRSFQECSSRSHMSPGDFRNVSEGFSGFPRVFPRCSTKCLREFQRALRKLSEGFWVFPKV